MEKELDYRQCKMSNCSQTLIEELSTMKKATAYYRVSTDNQQYESQRNIINTYALGNPEIGKINRKRSVDAKDFADRMKNLIQPMLDSGMTQRAICDSLNDSGVKTRNGGKWGLIQLQRVISRWSN